MFWCDMMQIYSDWHFYQQLFKNSNQFSQCKHIFNKWTPQLINIFLLMLKSEKHFFSSKVQLQSGPFGLVKHRLPWVVINWTFVQLLLLLLLLVHILFPDGGREDSAAEHNNVRRETEVVVVFVFVLLYTGNINLTLIIISSCKNINNGRSTGPYLPHGCPTK